MKRPTLLLAPLALTFALFFGVLLVGGAPLVRRTFPDEPLRAEVCTWHCHNHGCPHRPRLPRWLTSDEGLFGETIRGLYRMGSFLSHNRGTGYGLANLFVFCVAWPGVTYGLYAIVLRQRETLARLKTKGAR